MRIQKALQIARESGVRGVANRAAAFAYRRGIRPWLPATGPVYYAGIPVVYDRKWGDRLVPQLWRLEAEDAPDYESALVAGLKEHVRPGDRVVVVGGGVGVTATIAALQAGVDGRVECFEGAAEGVEKVRRTAARNGVADRVTVHHAVVARSILVYGTQPVHAVLAPSKLPECDVLELDCEGAEADILRALVIRPRVILVESHGLYGASSVLVASLLEELGYRTSQRGIAELRLQAVCEQHDIRVVLGTLDAGAGSA